MGYGERSKGRLVAYVAAGLLVVVAGVRYLEGQGDGPPPASVSIADGAREHGGTADGGGAGLYVHVAGAVRDGGLLRVPAGTRVGAAIERAGGTRPGADLTGVNLAAELQDGQQVIVPRRGAAALTAVGGAVPVGSSPTSTGAPGSPAAPVSLSQATAEQLDASVEGIGPVLAARIVEFRDERGSVSSIEQLEEVDGIGEARLGALREALVP